MKDIIKNNQSHLIISILASILTFFLGFIGTFISRLILAKQPLSKSILPTCIHLSISIILIILIFGYITYILGSIYFIYINFIIVKNSQKLIKD